MSKLGATVYYRPTPLDGFTGHQEGLCAGIVAADLGEEKVNLSIFSGDGNYYSRRGVLLVEGPVQPGQCTLRSAADVPLAQIVEKINAHGESIDHHNEIYRSLGSRLIDLEARIEAVAKDAAGPAPATERPQAYPGGPEDYGPRQPASDEPQDSTEAPAATSDAKGDEPVATS